MVLLKFMWGYCIHCGGHLLIYTVANNEYTLNGVFIAEHVDNVDSMGFGGESIDVPTFQANDWCPLNRSERSLHFVQSVCSTQTKEAYNLQQCLENLSFQLFYQYDI